MMDMITVSAIHEVHLDVDGLILESNGVEVYDEFHDRNDWNT